MTKISVKLSNIKRGEEQDYWCRLVLKRGEKSQMDYSGSTISSKLPFGFPHTGH